MNLPTPAPPRAVASRDPRVAFASAVPGSGPGQAAVAEPEVDEAAATEERVETPWRVILYDDSIHTFDDVIVQLVKATGCSEQQAERHAWTVHTEGKDCVYTGEFFECFRVQGVLREIQLVTEIEG